jgi:hypothetical protein
MTSLKYKKGGDIRVALLEAVNGDAFTIPAGCKVESVVTKKVGTVAGNFSIGADAVFEVASLEVIAGVASTYEVESFSVTGAPTSDGNITVDGETIAILDLDDEAGVATKIRAHSFTNWTTGGTGANVILTAKTYGDKTLVVVSAGTTGATFSAVSEDTPGTDKAGNVTVTLNGAATTVAMTSTETTTTVATKIRNTSFSGWTTGGTGTTVTFTSTSYGNKTDAIYSPGSTGAIGTMSTSQQGTAGEGVVASVALGTVDGAIAVRTVAAPIQSMTVDYTGTINIDSAAKADVFVVMQKLD